MQQLVHQNLEELWNFKETMGYLRICRSTLLRWMANGKIVGHKVGGTWRFYPSEVYQLVEGQKAEQGEQS